MMNDLLAKVGWSFRRS